MKGVLKLFYSVGTVKKKEVEEMKLSIFFL